MAVFVAVDPHVSRGDGRSQTLCPAALRALTIWPRLDRRALARAGCDKERMARYISHRTRMPLGSIETLLDRS
jgi:hypothetical protein